MRDAEVILPRRSYPQPVPFLSDGGDCVACCLAGLLRSDPESIYRDFESAKKKSYSWYEVRQTLWDMYSRGLLSDIITETPFWMPKGFETNYGMPGFEFSMQWHAYIRMALQAGYYAVANVTMEKKAPVSLPDHAVLLVGSRTLRTQHESGGATLEEQVLVSCSSTRTPDLEWVNTHHFLRDRGGYNVYLARPA